MEIIVGTVDVKLEVTMKMVMVVKVGGQSEVTMCENGSGSQNGLEIGSGHMEKWKWWSKWVSNQKWPCVKMEVVIKVGGKLDVPFVKMAVVVKVGEQLEVAMCKNGS